jgi:LPXTG-site transpeptidase (sortase) family protein
VGRSRPAFSFGDGIRPTKLPGRGAAARQPDAPKLVPGDEIDLETRYGTYRYHVTGSRIVGPKDRTVLVPDAPDYHLTLTTCWPLWAGAFATQRYVIFTDQFDPNPPRQMFN